MAAERLPPSRSSNSLHDDAGHNGRGGKLRLSRHVLFRKKPYDRPAHAGSLDRPLSCSLNGCTPSLPSRLVDSASNLILSSATYLFESFFKRRRILWIGNGIQSTARTNAADMERKEGSKLPHDSLNQDKDGIPPLQGPALEVFCEKTEGEDSDVAKVEGIIKQQFLSREEVKRLSDILQSRTSGRHMVGFNLDASRQQEKVQQVEVELNPVQLAKAYMGEHTSHFVSTTPQGQRLPHRYGDGPSSVKSIKEEVYERSPAQASKSGLASAERMLKRRLIADDEDNVILRGPRRRVRQKMTLVANTSPYIRQVTAVKGLRKPNVPILQLTERTEQADEVVEEPKLPVKGKSVEEPTVVAVGNDVDPAESSKARERSEMFSKNESLARSTSSDLEKSNRKPTVEHVEAVAPITSKVAVEAVFPITSKVSEYSATGLLATPSSELPASTPENTKGFHMSAFFEDSSSDEESGPPVKATTSTEEQRPGSSTSPGTLQENAQKQPSTGTPKDGSFSSAAEFTQKSSSIVLEPIIAAEPPNFNFNSFPVASSPATHLSESPSMLASTVATGRSSPLQSNLKSLPVVAHGPSATEEEFLPFTTPAKAPSSVVLSTSPTPMSASPSGPATLPVTSVSVSAEGAAPVAVVPSSAVADTELKVAATEGVAVDASGLSPVAASLARVSEMANTAAPAAGPILSIAWVPTAASVSPVGSAASSLTSPAKGPVVCQASTGGANVDSMTAADSFLKAGNGVGFPSGSPGADRQAEGDKMATDPMTEEPYSSFTSSPSASLFLFGAASTASMSSGQMPSFGSNATATSPFSFPIPSSAPSLSSPFSFGSQSSSSAGQLFTFGASGTAPFSMSTQSPFSFGSSAASATLPVFTTTSSAPLTFPATPAAPSFQFGASAASAALTSSTSLFGAQMTPAASAFVMPGGQSNGSAFVFSAPTTSSVTPTPPAFQFGGAGASNPSLGGQSFTFGGQPAPMAGNPFANGTSNAAPFQFGNSAAAPSQSVFPSAVTTPSFISFGVQQPSSSPFQFTFGAQPGGQPSGQPFSFGGQPTAPPQSPFSLTGVTSQNAFPSAGASGMDFGGGFSLGAAGGEKSGRKFIKAKRIGGAKRGK